MKRKTKKKALRRAPAVGDVVRIRGGGVHLGVEHEATVVAVEHGSSCEGGVLVSVDALPRRAPALRLGLSINWLEGYSDDAHNPSTTERNHGA